MKNKNFNLVVNNCIFIRIKNNIDCFKNINMRNIGVDFNIKIIVDHKIGEDYWYINITPTKISILENDSIIWKKTPTYNAHGLESYLKDSPLIFDNYWKLNTEEKI